MRTTFRGTHAGGYAGVPATGKRFEFAAIDILRVEGGQMAEHWGLGDDLGLLTQLGANPRRKPPRRRRPSGPAARAR